MSLLPGLDLTLLEVVLILIIPLFFELPRAIIKTIFLISSRNSFKLSARDSSVSLPKVSIIVPAHNEGEIIDTAISSLVDLDYPRKEIIIVDDNSSDDTYLKVKPYASKGLVKLFKKTDPMSNKARAVNYGVRFSSGDFVVVIDADTVINRESLGRVLQPFADESVVGVAGNIRVYNDRSLLGRLQAYEYFLAMELGRAFQSSLQILMIIPGAFGAFRADIFRQLGQMDEDTITEDFDFALKLRKTRGRIIFVGGAIAWTSVPTTWRSWIRQRVRWTRGQVQTLKKHKDLLLSWKFGARVWLSAFDMLFMDVVLLFMRTTWIFIVPFIYPHIPLWKVGSVIILFYIILELFQAGVGVLMSPRRKRDVLSLPLIPINVLFYRPIYGVVRFYAYVQDLLGLKARW